MYKNRITIKDTTLQNFQLFKEKWRQKNRLFGQYLDKLNIHPYLTFLKYNVKIRRLVYTTNWIEQFNKTVRRTLKIRETMPNQESVLALITTAAINMEKNRYKYKLYQFKQIEEEEEHKSIAKTKEQHFLLS